MKKVLLLLGFCCVVLLFTTCEPPEAPVPTITGVEPAAAGPGEVVQISGTNLPYALDVVIGGVDTTFRYDGDQNLLHVVVPREAKEGPTTLYIRTADDKSNDVAFTVLPTKPLLERIDPEVANLNDTISILGKNFEEELLVHLNELEVKPLYVRADSLRVRVPATSPTGKVDVTLSLRGRKSNTLLLTVVNPDQPTITVLLPQKAPVGATIQVEGKRFKGPNLQVLFSNTVAENVTILSEELLKVVVPSNAQSGEIKVKTHEGVSNGVFFNVVSDADLAPVIDRLTPESAAVGSQIEVRGRNFTVADITLSLAGKKIPDENITIEHDEQLFFTVPSGASSGDLVVSNKYGSDNHFFTVLIAPHISQLLPKANPVKGQVWVLGEHLHKVVAVEVGGQLVPKEKLQLSADFKVLAFEVPALAVGDYQLKLIAEGQLSSNSKPFVVLSGYPNGLPGIGYDNIVLPNALPGAQLGSVDNDWVLVNTGSGIRLNSSPSDFSEPEPDEEGYYPIFNENDDIIGRYSQDSTFMELIFGGNIYQGRLDQKYQGVKRFLLMPVEGGKLLEMLSPSVVIDEVSPTILKIGEEISVKGRIFDYYHPFFRTYQPVKVFIMQQNNVVAIIDEGSYGLAPDGGAGNPFNSTISFTLDQEGLTPGTYQLLVSREEGFDNSNPVTIEIKE